MIGNSLAGAFARSFFIGAIIGLPWVSAVQQTTVNRTGTSLPTETIAAEQVRQLLAEAAYHETYGRNEERDRAIQAAAELDPHHPAVASLLGRIEARGQWRDALQWCSNPIADPVTTEYQQRRDQQPDTVDGQVALAQWCDANNLEDRARAHWFRVIVLEPDHSVARERLGYVRVENRWIAEADRVKESIYADINNRRFEAWSEPVLRLARKLEKTKDADEARRLIAAFDQPAAIVALEQILGSYNEATALLVAEQIATIPEVEATDSLIRFSVLSPWESVRTQCAQSLGKRDPYQFVPTMLAEISSPIISQWQVIAGARGDVLHQQVFVRDIQGERQMMRLDTVYNRRRSPGTQGLNSLQQAFDRINASNQQNIARQQVQNQQIQWLNDRIMSALRIATGNNFPNEARTWWRWWNDRNGVYLAGELPVNEIRRYDEVELVDSNIYGIPPVNSNSNVSAATPVTSVPSECLVAGTGVWTDRGMIAVESVQVGDLVVSKNVDSGELSFKPVVRRTIRPRTMTVVVELESGDKIGASGGHPFWVSGEGWVLADDLQPGMAIHGLRGSVRVVAKSAGPAEELYNLIVADNQNYFVGPSAVLSHDNSLRSANKQLLPGVPK